MITCLEVSRLAWSCVFALVETCLILALLSICKASSNRLFESKIFIQTWHALKEGRLRQAIVKGRAYLSLCLATVPRALRTVFWVARTIYAYELYRLKHLKDDPESVDYQAGLSELHTRRAIELLKVCRANGGVFVKAGQFASAFGAVPIEYRMKLANLEDKASPKPFAQIRQVLLEELGPDAESIFSNFNKTATAAASLAQVHKACLVTGEDVAVKVQYPEMASAVKADLRVIWLFSAVTGYLFPSYDMNWLCKELSHKLSLELNFMNEIYNARKLDGILHRRHGCATPYMYESLSSPRLIIMEWVHGMKINDLVALRKKDMKPKDIGMSLVRLFAELTLIHGYVHGDPHPGNLMVRSRGRRNFLQWLLRDRRQPYEIVLIDHGTYFSAGTELREQMCQLWCSFVLHDKLLQAEVSYQLAGERGSAVLPVLLTHTARSRQEERRLQQSLGISGFSDMSLLLQTASNDLVEMLRINTVIRGVSNQLGVTMDERKRVFAWFAHKGLPPRSKRAPHINHRYNQVAQRVQLCAIVVGWHALSQLKMGLSKSWRFMLGLIRDVL